MPENKGYYKKYEITRTDGRPMTGRTWVLEIDVDKFAVPSLRAYRSAAALDGAYPEMVAALDDILSSLDSH